MAEPAALCEKPVAVAMALTVVVALMVMGPEKTEDDVVGALPSVV